MKRSKMTNKKFSIYEFLLYFIFEKAKNYQLKENAVKTLALNFKQRNQLIDEIIKIELLIS